MNYKPFDKKEYERNDERAKKAGQIFLRQKGCMPVRETQEFYKLKDFSVIYKGEDIPVEVEIKNMWKSSFKWLGYSTVSIPTRKNQSKSTLYLLFNDRMDTLLYCPTSEVLSSTIIKKNTSKGTVLEPFFDSPLSKWRMEALINGVWSEVTNFGGVSLQEILIGK